MSGNTTNIVSPSFYGGQDVQLRGTEELEKLFRAAYVTKYTELGYTGDDLTTVEVWEDGTKTIKLFTRTLGYTGDDLTTVTTVDDQVGTTLLVTLGYTGDDLTSTTKVVT